MAEKPWAVVGIYFQLLVSTRLVLFIISHLLVKIKKSKQIMIGIDIQLLISARLLLISIYPATKILEFWSL